MNKKPSVHVLLGGAALLLPALAAAYEVAPVENGGSIVGRATLEGRPRQPPAATFPKNLNPQDRAYCEKKPAIVTPYYRVGRAGALADVVVWIENIYHAVTADDGSFSLPQVPAGEYTLKAWHEAAGTLSRKIKVSAASTVRADFVFQAR